MSIYLIYLDLHGDLSAELPRHRSSLDRSHSNATHHTPTPHHHHAMDAQASPLFGSLEEAATVATAGQEMGALLPGLRTKRSGDGLLPHVLQSLLRKASGGVPSLLKSSSPLPSGLPAARSRRHRQAYCTYRTL